MDETTTKDNDGGTSEQPNIGNGIVVYESWEEMLDSWEQRALALADEMTSFGFASFWLGCSYEKIDGGNTTYRSVRRGNYFTILGMLTEAATDLMNSRE